MQSITRVWVLSLLLISLLVCTYAGAAEMEDNESFFEKENLTRGAPDIPLSPQLPAGVNLTVPQDGMIIGNGTLDQSIMLNGTAGEKVAGILQVFGNDDTSWSYQLISQNQSDAFMVIGVLQVKNAQSVIVQGQSVTPAKNVAFSGAELSGLENTGPAKCSGNFEVAAIAIDNMTYSVLQTSEETGSMYHLTRSYHYYYSNNLPQGPEVQFPVSDLKALDNITQPQAIFYMDQVAQSTAVLEEGTMDSYIAYGLSGPSQAISLQYPVAKEVQNLEISTRAAGSTDPVLLNSTEVGERIHATDVSFLNHQGSALYAQGTGSAQGSTILHADGKMEKTSYIDNRHFPTYSGGYTHLSASSSSKKEGSDRVSIPVTYEGWTQAGYFMGTSYLDESHTARGAAVKRTVNGGEFREDEEPVYQVETESEVGSDTAQGASDITGSATFRYDGNHGNETSLSGRWILTSPDGSAVQRVISATMPGAKAFDDSCTLSGPKYVNENAYYRNGMVDVS